MYNKTSLTSVHNHNQPWNYLWVGDLLVHHGYSELFASQILSSIVGDRQIKSWSITTAVKMWFVATGGSNMGSLYTICYLVTSCCLTALLPMWYYLSSKSQAFVYINWRLYLFRWDKMCILLLGYLLEARVNISPYQHPMGPGSPHAQIRGAWLFYYTEMNNSAVWDLAIILGLEALSYCHIAVQTYES